MAIRVQCPICEDVFLIEEEKVAYEIECPSCGSFFRKFKRPRRVRKRRKKLAFLWIIGSVAILIILLALLPSGEYLLHFRNEPMARKAMRRIAYAQQCYKERYGTYSTLRALREERLLAFDLASATGQGAPKWGYRYYVDFDHGASWFVVAIPAEPGESGTKSFYLDQTEVMRWKPHESEGEIPAGPHSPLLGE